MSDKKPEPKFIQIAVALRPTQNLILGLKEDGTVWQLAGLEEGGELVWEQLPIKEKCLDFSKKS